MKTSFEKHLDEDQLLKALVDEQGLSHAFRMHLDDCQLCKGELGSLQESLETFGRKAEEHVPAATRKVHLEEEGYKTTGAWNLFSLPSYGAAAVITVALLIFLWPRPDHLSEINQFASQGDFVEDEIFMQEINELIENPLPRDFSNITSDMTIGFDDDFLEFVVPDFIDDVQSYNFHKGGIKKC